MFTNSVGMVFVGVPKGDSWLGGGGGKPGTKKFTLEEDMMIGQFEVTQGQWKAIMDGKNPSKFKDLPDADNLPVEQVSYDMVQEFIRRLNEKEKSTLGGRKYRLPTEEEWEYSYRGGPISQEESAYHFYFDEPTNDLSSSDANFNGNYPEGTGKEGVYLERPCKVGSYKPNKLGIYDMSGNVWEWTDSRYKAGSTLRVLRGGGWYFNGRYCRSAFRLRDEPGLRCQNFGFRLVIIGTDAD